MRLAVNQLVLAAHAVSVGAREYVGDADPGPGLHGRRGGHAWAVAELGSALNRYR